MVKGNSVDALIAGLEAIIQSRNHHSSLTDDDILTLQNCIETLRIFKTGDYKDLKLAAQVVDMVLKVFTTLGEIKDLF
jgi:hypothetical protein